MSGDFNNVLLCELERHYIRLYNTVRSRKNKLGLNLSEGDGKGYVSKPVYKYDLDGNYLMEHNSMTLREEGIKIERCRAVANPKTIHAKKHAGAQWRNYKVKKIDPICYGKNKYKNIYQFNLNGDFIKKWSNLSEAERAGYSKGGMIDCINKKQGKYGGYIWGLSKVTEEYKSPKLDTRSVHMYSLDGKYIMSFLGVSNAANHFGGSMTSEIIANIKGKLLSAYKHLWSFDKKDFIDPYKGNRYKPKPVKGLKKKLPPNTKPVVMKTIDGEFICQFESIGVARIKTGADRHGISLTCKGKQNSCGGFLWELVSN